MAALNVPLAAGLAAIAAGGVGYVFLAPYLSGERRGKQRRRALGTPRSTIVERSAAASRRDQVAKSLKELEAKTGQAKVSLDLRLARAGLDWSRRKFVTVSGGVALVLAAAVLALSGSPLAGLLTLFVGGFGLPSWALTYLRKRRIAQFIDELPTAIDVVVRGLRSGIPLTDCLGIIAREAREPLRDEFRLAMEAQALGMPLAEAIQRMVERVPVTEVNFFAIVLAIQQKSGGNLSEALGNLSRVLRERKKMAGKIQAMSMEAKASAAIIGALPFAVGLLTYLSSPSYIALLWTTNIGKIALAASAVWMLIGVVTMKKMISFEV